MNNAETYGIPDSKFTEAYDWERHAGRSRGNRVLELITEPAIINGIAWQLYRVKYSRRKERPAERVVGLQIAAGNIALPVFWRKFVTFVGEGDFNSGADRIIG